MVLQSGYCPDRPPMHNLNAVSGLSPGLDITTPVSPEVLP